MKYINLLPWRELSRRKNKKIFLLGLSLSFIFSIIILLCCHYLITFKNNQKQIINQQLQQQIQTYLTKIQIMENKKKQQAQLQEQIHFVRQLKNNDAQLNGIFENIVLLTPKDIHITSIKYEKNVLHINGNASENSDIYQFEYNMEKSKFFLHPQIMEIKSNKDNDQNKEFYLQVNLDTL